MEENKDDIIEVEKVEETKQEEKAEPKTETPKEEPKVEVINEEPQNDKKGFSIAALVLGIIAIVFCCVWYISIPCGILAIIFGIVGIKSSKKGMSIAGLITGSIGLIISGIVFNDFVNSVNVFVLYNSFQKLIASFSTLLQTKNPLNFMSSAS